MSILGGMFASAGSSFLNSMASGHGDTLGSRIMTPYQNFNTPWGKGPYTGHLKEGIRWRVEDAKAAGIHPLFALGSPGAGATVNVPHRPRSGGGGGTYPQGGPSKSAERRAEEQHQQNIQRGHVELLKSQSELRRMLQVENYKRPALWPEDEGQSMGQGAQVYPFGTKKGLPLRKRPLVQFPRTSRPMRAEIIADDGYRYRIIDPDTGDEISQADLAAQIVLRHTRKARKAPGRELWLQARKLAAKIRREYRQGLKSTRDRRQR